MARGAAVVTGDCDCWQGVSGLVEWACLAQTHRPDERLAWPKSARWKMTARRLNRVEFRQKRPGPGWILPKKAWTGLIWSWNYWTDGETNLGSSVTELYNARTDLNWTKQRPYLEMLKAKTDHKYEIRTKNFSKKHLVNSDNSQSLSQLSKVNSRHAKGADMAVWLTWQKG